MNFKEWEELDDSLSVPVITGVLQPGALQPLPWDVIVAYNRLFPPYILHGEVSPTQEELKQAHVHVVTLIKRWVN